MEPIVSNLDDYLDLVIWDEEGKYVIKHSSYNGYKGSENIVEKGNDYYEGALKRVYNNSYERDPKTRAACIKHYGYTCQVCKFDYEKKYGIAGKNKIHVHHLNKLSQVGKRHLVDPVKDMTPVCANCHFIIHSREKPYTIDEMKEMLNQNKDI